MALLTQDAVEAQLGESSSLLTAIGNKYNINTLKDDLEAQIKALKAKEQSFLNIMGVSNIDQLNLKLKKLRDEELPAISNLSGTGLNKVFLQPTRISQENITGKYKQKFIDYFSAQEGYGTFLSPDEFQNWFKGILNTGHKGTPFTATSGFIDATALEQVIISKLSRAQQARVKSFLGLKESENLGATITTSTTSNTLTQTLNYNSDWGTITNFSKGSDIQAMLKSGSITQQDVDNVLKNLETYIVSKVPGSALFNQVVHEVLYEPNSIYKIFYGGNMINGITGLLGEIQGLYIIRRLLGKQVWGTKGYVDWVGGINNPHEDLIMTVLENGVFKELGIQIKNSAKDIEKLGQLSNVSFTRKSGINISDIRSKLGSDYDDILKIYEMEAFNIEYEKDIDKNGKIIYVARSNGEFSPTRGKIEALARAADRTMALFAASLMYMSVNIQTNEITEGGNSVYLIGGTVFQLASEILTKLFAQLEAEEEKIGFKITSYFDKASNGIGTIVDYFNSKDARKGSVSEARGKVILESSYTFTL